MLESQVKVRCSVATSCETGKLVLQLMFYLNLLFQNTWSYIKHYNYICKIISQKIGVLKYIRDCVKFDILKMVYSSIVLPRMDYVSIFCSRCPKMVK